MWWELWPISECSIFLISNDSLSRAWRRLKCRSLWVISKETLEILKTACILQVWVETVVNVSELSSICCYYMLGKKELSLSGRYLLVLGQWFPKRSSRLAETVSCCNHRSSGFTPNLLNEEFWEWGPVITRGYVILMLLMFETTALSLVWEQVPRIESWYESSELTSPSGTGVCPGLVNAK